MADNAQKYIMKRVVDTNGNLATVHPETDAGQVLYENAALGNDIKNVDDALGALADLATSSGVTGVKGAAESSYRKGNVNLTPANIGAVASNDAITAGTFTKVDVDAKGLVTGGSQATLDDIADGSTRKLSNYIPTSQKGANGGVATLGEDGRVPNSQLPSYVDDVLEYENLSGFPTTGSAGKIYVDKQTNKTYRWSGSGYTEISASLALGETSSTAYAGDKGKQNANNIAGLTNTIEEIIRGDTSVGFAEDANALGGVSADQYAKLTDIPENELVIVTGSYSSSTLTLETGAYTTIQNAINDDKIVVLDVTGIGRCYYDSYSAGTYYFRNVNTSGVYAISVTASKADAYSYTYLRDVSDEQTGAIISSISVGTGKIVNVARRAMRNSDLPDSGVTAGAYSLVSVDSKGIVTGGNQLVQWGTSTNNTPSATLAVGGLFFELVE